MTDNIIIILIVLIIVGPASLYIYNSKKKGRKCIGCPDTKNCNGNCSTCVTRKISEE